MEYQKLDKLKTQLEDMKSVVVAFSGGVDSTLLLKIAYEVLGDNVLAVTARTSTLSQSEQQDVKDIIKFIGARHMNIEYEELDNQNFASNPVNRCYYCKSMLYSRLVDIARKGGINHVADGTNQDDGRDIRPGFKAAEENNVVSPLKDCGFTKKEIRELSKDLGLPTWNKPEMACLSSRIPHGSVITIGKLSAVEKAESSLKSLGLRQIRVRHHGQLARIEAPKEEFHLLEANREKIAGMMNDIGFKSTVFGLYVRA